jgi:hypothetical protein
MDRTPKSEDGEHTVTKRPGGAYEQQDLLETDHKIHPEPDVSSLCCTIYY